MCIATTRSLIDLRILGRRARQIILGLCAVLLFACTSSGGSDGTKTGGNAVGAPVAARALVDAPIEVTPLSAPGQAVGVPVNGPGPADPAASKATPAPSNPREAGKPVASEPVAIDAPADVIEFVSPQALACRKKGNTWAEAGSEGAMACISKTGDAGKSCRSGKDCEGFCLARSGTCAPYSPLFGCNDILQDDGVEVNICLD
jgi:hypothetical protein